MTKPADAIKYESRIGKTNEEKEKQLIPSKVKTAKAVVSTYEAKLEGELAQLDVTLNELKNSSPLKIEELVNTEIKIRTISKQLEILLVITSELF